MADAALQGPRAFTTTHWSLVDKAGASSSEAQRAALIELLNRYMAALRSHLIYRKGIDPNRADDLLQGFLLSKVIEQDLISMARKERGRFRSFLLTALDRYVISEARAENAAKRGKDKTGSLGDDVQVRAPGASPDEKFEVVWARQLLSETLRRMQEECKASARPDVWGVFEARILDELVHQREPMPYDEVIQKFGFKSPAQAFNVLTTAKRMFVRILRSLIAEYEPDEENIDAEISELQRLLALAGTQE